MNEIDKIKHTLAIMEEQRNRFYELMSDEDKKIDDEMKIKLLKQLKEEEEKNK